MKRRYVQMGGELVEVTGDWLPEPRAHYHVMRDISPYRSMIDGSIVTSRSRHREHLRAHGCVELGNDSSILDPRRREHPADPRLKARVRESFERVAARERRY